MTSNYFQGTIQSPRHISIGAVVRNGEGKICAHYFKHFTHSSVGTLDNFYLLMRETIEPNESIEECLHRGLQEEFGMKAKLVSYLGSIVSHFVVKNTEIEKTTLYFLCEVISQHDEDRAADDLESVSEITWNDPTELIAKMREQGKRLGREDVDESSALESFLGLKFSA